MRDPEFEFMRFAFREASARDAALESSPRRTAVSPTSAPHGWW